MRPRLNCHTVISRLSAYQDDELPLSEKEQFEQHLSDCPSCNAQFIKLQQAWEAMGVLSDLSVSSDFYRKIQRKLPDTRGRFEEPAYGGWFQRLVPTSAVASLIAAGILLGAAAGNSLVARTPAQPPNAENSLLSSLSVFDPVPPGTVADGFNRLMTHSER
jgi:anti-sigma factor RsiW